MKILLYLFCFATAVLSSGIYQELSKPPGKADIHPNILWINVEDISPALGCYGDPNADTPHLDQLAREGILYRHAYSTAPICSPSRSSFITGVYSTSMGTQHLRSEVRRPDFIKTLPEFLKAEGYFVTNYGKTDWNFPDEEVFDHRAQTFDPWRKRPKDAPFFSMFVIGGTHEGSANFDHVYQSSVAGLPDSLYHRPGGAYVPPYYPKTPGFQKTWARYYDLISRMDMRIGEIIGNLEEDDLRENTIIFFFSDHGFGLPRYKRYLYKTGIHVPLLVYLPKKYQHLAPDPPGTKNDQLVSLVDMVPSVLNMMGLEKPSYMQGQAFLGKKPEPPRQYIYGERSRADDLFEMSRAVLTKDFMYIRNYMPHLPYIRTGQIQSARKEGYGQLRELHGKNQLSDTLARLFRPKPTEELYDLRKDPLEIKNLADDLSYRKIKKRFKQAHFQWVQSTRDLGFLPEAEYMIRAGHRPPYEMARTASEFPVGKILRAANLVGTFNARDILTALRNPEAGVRYWAVIAAQNLPSQNTPVTEALSARLSDASPSVQIAAAEALCQRGTCEAALPVLKKWVADDRPWLALQAARSLVELGPSAKPIGQDILGIQKKLLGEPGAKYKYRDFEYSSFIGWALETVLENSGIEPL